MKSLRARLNEGKAAAPARGGKAKLGKKIALMDLDNDDEDDDAGDDSVLDKEQKFHEQLEKRLTRCQLCGPTKFCRISRNGDHVNLTFQQRRGWVAALVILFCCYIKVSRISVTFDRLTECTVSHFKHLPTVIYLPTFMVLQLPRKVT